MNGINISFRDNDRLGAIARNYRKVALRALNKVTKSAETQANRLIRERYNISRSDLDKRLSYRLASISKLQGTVRATGRSIPLMQFSPRPGQPRRKGARVPPVGVRVTVVRGRAVVVKGGFIASMKSGKVGVFKRKGEARLPIQELKGISAAGMLRSRPVREKLVAHIRERLPVVMKQELNYALQHER